MDRSESDSRSELWLALGALLWLVAVALRWPLAVSFGDEVGYVGEVRMLLEGRLRPLHDSPGIWVVTANGRVSKFPLLLPLLVTPLFAIAPRLVFLSGVVAALALAFVASRALKSWGRSPLWGIIVLAHPAFVILARTVMADLLLATFSVAAWWGMRRGRVALTAVLLALVVATKVTGLAIAGVLLAGEVVRLREDLLRRDRQAFWRLAWWAVGILAGIVLTAALNLVSVGRLWFAYRETLTHLSTPAFWPGYFRKTAPVHAASLLLLPPALLAGAWPLWRRRELGPLLVALGLPAMMGFYFFVDRGRSAVETLVLSQRLILPAVAFLLIGYADLAARLVSMLPRVARSLVGLGAIAPAVLAFGLSSRHRAWQEPGAAALMVASDLLADRGHGTGGDLGLTATAVKAGILYRGPISRVPFGGSAPEVVLCSTESASYREPNDRHNCRVPGYEDRFDRGPFHVLARRRP